MIDGEDLNDIVKSYKYNSWHHYFVIPWQDGGYTALELNSYEDEPPIFEREYKDQRQIRWKLKNGWDWCY